MKEEYHTTRFKTPPLTRGIPQSFFIITAWNPLGQRAGDEDNQKANASLEARLKDCQLSRFPVTGFCQDHSEDGFGITCSRDEAIALGKEFRQDAIYQISNNQVILVDCKEQEADELVGEWSQLLVS